MARFVGHPAVLDEQDWADLGTALGSGGSAGIRGVGHVVPSKWAPISDCGWRVGWWRWRGIASRLIRAVGAGIRARGETPFLHAVAHNTTAISLSETLGFTVRKKSKLTLVQVA